MNVLFGSVKINNLERNMGLCFMQLLLSPLKAKRQARVRACRGESLSNIYLLKLATFRCFWMWFLFSRILLSPFWSDLRFNHSSIFSLFFCLIPPAVPLEA